MALLPVFSDSPLSAAHIFTREDPRWWSFPMWAPTFPMWIPITAPQDNGNRLIEPLTPRWWLHSHILLTESKLSSPKSFKDQLEHLSLRIISMIPLFFSFLSVCPGRLISTYGSKWSALCVALCCASVTPDSCDPMDCGPPGSSVQEILQARILEWVAMLFSRGHSGMGSFTLPKTIKCCGTRY